MFKLLLLFACFGSLVQSQTVCSSFGCANKTIDISTTLISNGYKSNSGQTSIVRATYFQGYGAFGFYQASSVTATATQGQISTCSGDSTCSSVDRLHGFRLYIYGMNGCSHSNYVTAVAPVWCLAEQSCSYSTLAQANAIQAFGAYSVLGSTIYSNGTDMTVVLGGYYAGFNGTLICTTGSTCNVVCYGNGCHYFRYYCENGATCNTYLCNDTLSIPCPISLDNNNLTSSNFSETSLLTQIKKLGAIPDTIPFYNIDINNNFNNYDQISTQMDNECTNAKQGSNIAMVFDNYQESGSWNSSRSGLAGKDIICCRGYQSCAAEEMLKSGKYVICSGSEACINVGMIETDVLYCGGYISCSFINVTHNINASADGIVYCLGESSCKASSFYNSYVVYIGAYEAIEDTFFYGVTTIIIAATQGPSQHSFVYSRSSGTKLILLAENAFQDGTFLCESDDSCKVQCLVNGACDNIAEITCHGYCTIECQEMNGIQCPSDDIMFGNYRLVTPSPIPAFIPTMSFNSTDGEKNVCHQMQNQTTGVLVFCLTNLIAQKITNKEISITCN